MEEKRARFIVPLLSRWFGRWFGGGFGWGGGGGADEGGGGDFVELGPLGGEVLLALFGDVFLVHAGGFAVLVVEHLDDVHAGAVDGTEGSEALGVEGRVVLKVDEELRGAGIGASGGKDERAALVGLVAGIVLNCGLFPGSVDFGVGAETELRNEAGKYAEEAGVVKIVVLHEIVEAVGAKGRPCAGDGDGELAAGGVELDLIRIGSFGVEGGGVEKGAVVRGGVGCGGGFGFGGRSGGLGERGDGDGKRGECERAGFQGHTRRPPWILG